MPKQLMLLSSFHCLFYYRLQYIITQNAHFVKRKMEIRRFLVQIMQIPQELFLRNLHYASKKCSGRKIQDCFMILFGSYSFNNEGISIGEKEGVIPSEQANKPRRGSGEENLARRAPISREASRFDKREPFGMQSNGRW